MAVQIQHLEFIHNTVRMFGNPASPFWLLGLEESTDSDISADDQILKQHSESEKLIREGMVPLFQDNIPSRFLGTCPESSSTPTYQRTWGGYIKLLLSLENAQSASQTPWTLNDVREYQRSRLGSLKEDSLGSCLMELYPLPRKTRAHAWRYKEISHRPGLEFLASPATYKKHPLATGRARSLIAQVRTHQPKALFCFGSDCRHQITRHVDGPVTKYLIERSTEKEPLPIYTARAGATLIICSHHPVAPGVTDRYWRELGKFSADLLHDSSYMSNAA